ncbi:MAG: EcsC family protein [Acidimicrobiales bacterium]
MSRSKKYLQRKAIERIPAPALNMVGKAVLQGVDKAVEDRWERALRVAAEAEGDTVDKRVRSISKRFRRELSTMGAASGAVAAAPGLGTSAAAAALIADLGWFAMRSTDLIMAIGAAHGMTDSTVDERRAWVLSVLAFGEEAAEQFSTLLSEIDAGALIGGQQLTARLASLAGSDAATLDALRRINTSLAATVISKYGSRRSLLAVGKLLPFGIGAVVGGSANYGMIRVVGSQANRFFNSYGLLMENQPPPPVAAGAPWPLPTGAPAVNPDAPVGAIPPPRPESQPQSQSQPPPPQAGSARLPNPTTKLSKRDRRNSIPTDARKK